MAKGKKSKDKSNSKALKNSNSNIDIKTINIETEGLELIYDVADFFKVFGDSTRIRMLTLLLSGEYNVGEIAQNLNMTQSAVSHQLRVLRQSELVKFKKDGKTVYYSLDDDHVKVVLEQGINHIKHKNNYN